MTSGRQPQRVATAAAALLLAAACASPGLPPGGPPDEEAPKIVRITPDTGAVNARAPRVVFQFNEVVSERPQGAQSLDRLFVISPRDGEPDVDWNRKAISVRPRRGFRANTVYTVTMLPGLSDLRNNVRKDGAQTVFSTGPTIPASNMSGVVFDWPRGDVASAPLVEAIMRPDSVVFITVADSAGRFRFPHLAPGTYTVRAVVDANANRALDPRESWDSAAVTLRDSARLELFTFVHDSVGPGLSNVVVSDSVTLRVTFDRPLEPTQRFEPARFLLRAADSTAIPIASVQTAATYDSAHAVTPPSRTPPAAPAPAPPPAAARTDTARAARPRPSRPVPPTDLVLRLGRRLAQGASFRLVAHDLRGLLGTSRESARVFTTPKTAPAAPPADSAARRPDSRNLRRVPDPVLPPAPAARPDTTGAARGARTRRPD